MLNPRPLDFNPPKPLRHPDVQNLLSSLGLRAGFLRRRTRELEQHTHDCILDGGNGIRLSGELSLPRKHSGIQDNDKLVVLFHGWEGSSQSAYMVSAALSLFEAGYTVFRLNLRDHGNSHHLNEGLFNSTLLDEVLAAIADIQKRWQHRQTYLAGFSLGANFALRIAIKAGAAGLSLKQVAAICPVMDPAHTLRALEDARFFYEAYFVRKWRHSLLKKLDFYPHYNYRQELLALKDLRSMHEFFVPRFTPYPNPDAYFNAYALDNNQLNQITLPTTIISSQDDPITKVDGLPSINNNRFLTIQTPRYGSHCAFLQDYRLTSWLDEQLINLFD